jgi:hypothetical protein
MSLSFSMREHFKGLMFGDREQHVEPMARQRQNRLRQGCRRGTQECVRHNDFNILRTSREN